jgi:hypothetical protein
MNTFAKLIAATAAVLMVAFAGYQLLPSNGGVGGRPTTAPSPDAPLLARGDFNVGDRAVELDAAGAGSNVTGRMSTADGTEAFDVDLQCTRATEDGVILIGGDVTDSTTGWAQEGTRAAIALERGTPMRATFVSQLDDPRAPDCLAFLEQMIDLGIRFEEDTPFVGTVELGP